MELEEMVNHLLHDFRQQELSKLTGVDQASISKLKNGKFKFPSAKKSDAIRNFYLKHQNEKTSVVCGN